MDSKLEGNDLNVRTSDETTGADGRKHSCSWRVLRVLHDKRFHILHLTLIVVEAIIVFFTLLIDLDVIPRTYTRSLWLL